MGWINSVRIFVCLLIVSFNSYAIDPTRQWFSFETENFIIHFNNDNRLLAEKAASKAELAHKKLAPLFNWQPEEKTHLVISDETDFSNAYATPYIFNRSVIFISPPDFPNTLEDYNDWLELLIVHEYVHILHLDKSAGIVGGIRNIFGRHIMLFPNLFQPSWLIEGIATHIETENADIKDEGTGRGQSSYFQMMMRMEVINGIKPVSQINLPMKTWPGRASDYLYGVFFYQFIEEIYGTEASGNLIEAYSNHIIPFMINSNAEQVLNKDITELWQEFSHWLEKKFNHQINNIKKQELVEGSAITNHGYYTGQIKASNDDLYYVRGNPFLNSALMKIDAKGIQREIVEIHSNARIDVHNEQGVLIAQPEYCNNYNLNYDLYVVKNGSNEIQRLTRCGRYRSAAWSADGSSILAVQINNGTNELHLLDKLGNKKSILWKASEGVVIGQPDWSLNGRYLLASVYRPESGWNIEQFDLHNSQWQRLTDDKAIDAYPVYIDDDKSIIFSSDRNDVYNIYKLNIETAVIEQLSHVMAGAFMALENNNNLYYVGYGVNGNDIYKMEKPRSIDKAVIENRLVSTGQDNLVNKPVISEIEKYTPWSSMKLRWWEPRLFIENEKTEIGFSTSGHDALAMHNYFFSLAYDEKNNLATGNIAYSYIDRVVIGATRESSIISDINGNYAATITKDDYYLYWLNPVTKYESSWNFILGVQAGINKEQRRESWISPIADFVDRQAGVALTFKNTKNYIRSISENNGRRVKLVYENSDVWHSDYTGDVYTLEWREFFQLDKQHALALRLTEAWGSDAPEDFRLGGESNDVKILDFILPENEVLFGKREYALRGYAEGWPQLSGRRMQLASLEWRFPVALVERGIMAPPVGLSQWSGALFMETGAAWDAGNSPEKYYSSAGFEIHADVTLFYKINTRMRLGYASGLDEAIGENRVYFSLGASF